MTWIKICGITNMEDALSAASLGIDALGFVFAPSPRKVEPEVAKKIIQVLPKTLLNVGVFVNEEVEEVRRVAKYCKLNALQFHGEESAEYLKKFSHPIFKAIHIKDLESLKNMEKYDKVSLLLDTYSPMQAGGTGNPFPWEIALDRQREERLHPVRRSQSIECERSHHKSETLGSGCQLRCGIIPGKERLAQNEQIRKGGYESG